MTPNIPILLVAGLVIIAATHVRQICLRLRLQPLVGFVLIGVLLRLIESRTAFLTPESLEQLDLLGQLGIVILLFKVGMNSNITGLLRQLRRALAVWFSDITVAATAGFLAAFYVLGQALVPSLFIAVAMSATSVGVSTAIWQQARLLDTEDGALLVDVGELDDISAILLMVLLFTAAPLLAAGASDQLGQALTRELLWILGKLAAFVLAVYLFARFAERRFTKSFRGLTATTIAVTGMACLIAGLGAWSGFSVAIGALFAGLAFSRDPQEFQIDRQLEPLYELLSPFFFIVIGLSVQLQSIATVLTAAAILLVAAVVGKVAGAGGAAMFALGPRRGWVIGISMVPRAEIALVVTLQGARMGANYVPPALLDAMSLVAITTALLVPLWLSRVLPPASAGPCAGGPPDKISR